MNATRRLLGLIAPYRAQAALALVLAVLACLLNFPLPLLIQELVDHSVTAGGLSPLLVLGLIGVFAAQAMTTVALAQVIGPVGLGVVRDLRHALYARLQRLGLPFYDRTPAGAIISRVMDDVAVVQALITSQALAILTDLGTTVVVLGLLVTRGVEVALAVVLVLGGYGATFLFFSRRIRSGSTEVRNRLDQIFGQLKERIDAVLVVKAYAREEAEIAEFAGRIGEAHGPRLRVGWLGAAFANLSAGLNGVGTTLVFAVGAFEVCHGRMSPGEAVSTATLAGLLFGPVTRLADLVNVFQQAVASTERLGEILDMEPDVLEPATPTPIGRSLGLVEFDRVGFAYRPGQPVVRDIRLRAEPGMKVAIVGPTGSGKTTLMNLLLRFYDPVAGEIRLDGVPIGRMATAELRRQIGVVPQEPILFARSLAENIRYGAPQANAAAVETAARAALVHDFAMALPQGYDTLVGEGGYKLSQGQRQRLAIARAFCKDPPVIILDEATSSLDTASELQVQAALAKLLEGRTAFVIAHRLATIVDADLIAVMDSGRIVQVGTHEALLADRDGLYAHFCARQFSGPTPFERRHADHAARSRSPMASGANAWQRDVAVVGREVLTG